MSTLCYSLLELPQLLLWSQTSSWSHLFVSTISEFSGSWPVPLHSEYEAPDSSPRQQPRNIIKYKCIQVLPALQQELRLHWACSAWHLPQLQEWWGGPLTPEKSQREHTSSSQLREDTAKWTAAICTADLPEIICWETAASFLQDLTNTQSLIIIIILKSQYIPQGKKGARSNSPAQTPSRTSVPQHSRPVRGQCEKKNKLIKMQLTREGCWNAWDQFSLSSLQQGQRTSNAFYQILWSTWELGSKTTSPNSSILQENLASNYELWHSKTLIQYCKSFYWIWFFCSSSRHRKAPDLFRLFNQLPTTIFFQVLIPYFLYSNVQTSNSHMSKLPKCLSWAFLPFQFLVSTQVHFLLALSNW